MPDSKSPLTFEWIDKGREATQPPNPNYPNGIDLNLSTSMRPSCSVDLPYPAKRCGDYIIRCSRCGTTAVVTTAGRADDPRSIKINCRNPARLQR